MDDPDAPIAIATIGRQAAATGLSAAGVLTLFGSLTPWLTCSTVGCDSPLQAFSILSGLDVGYGVLTLLAGILLTAIGIEALRSDGVSRYAGPAVLLALLVLASVAAFFITTFVFPDYSLSIEWPPRYGAILTACGGLIALAASLRLWRAPHSNPRPSPRRAPPV